MRRIEKPVPVGPFVIQHIDPGKYSFSIAAIFVLPFLTLDFDRV
jgi:hypothetical protein